MNTLVAVAIAPFGEGEELSEYVAAACKVIADSGLKYKTSSMFTEIEGEWDDVMRVVKDATFVLAEKGIRTEVILKADIRTGYKNMMDEKLDRLAKASVKNALRLYAITDRAWLNGKSLASQVELALQGGATMLQIREKNLDEKAFYEEALEIQTVCKKYKVPFIVNDNVELAAKIGADGVHVGQSDMKAKDVRSIIGPNKILGVSTQTVEEAIEAEKAGADYLGVGAVFPTSTKDADVLSMQTLKEICSSVKIPVVAIGGISVENAEKLAGTGIAGISVVSAIFAQADIKKATAELLKETEKLNQ